MIHGEISASVGTQFFLNEALSLRGGFGKQKDA